MHRSTLPYGLDGITATATSGLVWALWDLIGKALNQTLCKLLGGQNERIDSVLRDHPSRSGRELEEFRFLVVKVAAPWGPSNRRDAVRSIFHAIIDEPLPVKWSRCVIRSAWIWGAT